MKLKFSFIVKLVASQVLSSHMQLGATELDSAYTEDLYHCRDFYLTALF